MKNNFMGFFWYLIKGFSADGSYINHKEVILLKFLSKNYRDPCFFCVALSPNNCFSITLAQKNFNT